MKHLLAIIAVVSCVAMLPRAQEVRASGDVATLVDAPATQTDSVSAAQGEASVIDVSMGVIDRRFVGQGRCSQVCPLMAEICRSDGGSPGRCWCDEQAGGVTIGHIVCGR